MFKQSITEPMLVTPTSIVMSDSTHFRAITETEKVQKPQLLGAEETAAPTSMEVDIGSAARFIADLEDEQQGTGFPIHNKTDSPSKRKGWFYLKGFCSIFGLSSIKN